MNGTSPADRVSGSDGRVAAPRLSILLTQWDGFVVSPDRLLGGAGTHGAVKALCGSARSNDVSSRAVRIGRRRAEVECWDNGG